MIKLLFFVVIGMLLVSCKLMSNSGRTKEDKSIKNIEASRPSVTNMLEDKRFKMISFNGNSIPDNAEGYFIQFNSKDTKLETKTGCNFMFTSYTLVGDNGIYIEQLVSTKMYCENNIEFEYSRQLVKVDNYMLSADGKKLTLKIADVSIAEYLLDQ